MRRALVFPMFTSLLLSSSPFAAQPRRAPVPPEADLEAAEKSLRAAYKEEYSRKDTSDKEFLARRLLKDAANARNDHARLYVLLREARDLAAAAGSAAVAISAIEELAGTFHVDALPMKKSALEAAAKSAKAPGLARELAGACIRAVFEALEADDYAGAKKLVGIAGTASRRAKDPETIAWAKGVEKEVDEIQRGLKAAQASLDLLQKEPGNAAANLAAGKFLCFLKGDWRKGLPLLAKGSDPTLVGLAEKDLAGPKDPGLQLEAGDGWWVAAERHRGLEKTLLRLRSARWYLESVPRLSGPPKDRTWERIEQVAAETPSHRTSSAGVASELVVTRFNGKDLRGWEPFSGTWKISGDEIRSAGEGNRFLCSAEKARWVRVTFDFRGGNPGLYFASQKSDKGHVGINLDSEAGFNGEIRRAVDMGTWNLARVEFEGGSARAFLNGDKVYSAAFPSPSHVIVKAQRGELQIRGLSAIGLPERDSASD